MRNGKMKYYCEEVSSVLKYVGSEENGLSALEAERRLAQNGRNKLAEAKKDSLLKRFLNQLTEPMIIILLAAAFISGVLAVVEGEPFTDVIILAVEEDKSVSGLLLTLLDAQQYETLLAENCAQGLMMLRSHVPDLVILDLGLPGRDGLDFIREARRENAAPILVLTARSTERDKGTALDLAQTTTSPSPSARRSFWPASALPSDTAARKPAGQSPGKPFSPARAGHRLRQPHRFGCRSAGTSDPDGVQYPFPSGGPRRQTADLCRHERSGLGRV